MTRSETFVSRWGDPELDDTGYLRVPGFIMRNYHLFTDEKGVQVGMTAQEFTVMSHIIAFKYDAPDGAATPGLSTIATRMGVDVKSVRRAKKSLEGKGALRVTYRAGETSVYEFPELVRQCRLYEVLAGQPLTPVKSDSPVINGRADKSGRGTPPKIGSTPLPKLGDEDSIQENLKNQSSSSDPARAEEPPIRPNIFSVYEANIGILTPIIADHLIDAVATYPAGWVDEAIAVAVAQNKRSWAYAAGVLKRWERDGKDTKPVPAAKPAPTPKPTVPPQQKAPLTSPFNLPPRSKS